MHLKSLKNTNVEEITLNKTSQVSLHTVVQSCVFLVLKMSEFDCIISKAHVSDILDLILNMEANFSASVLELECPKIS